MYKRDEDGKRYHGEWQEGSVIQQKLEGPVGDGSIDYPNGDRFEGYFHLSFAHINGPAYMGQGTYTFASGDRIEHCWINGRDRLQGVYETLHADGTRSIAMWHNGERTGIEIADNGKTCNYRERGLLIHAYSQSDFNYGYTYTPDGHGFNRLEVTLHDGKRLVHQFKDNGNEPDLFCEIYYPDGDWMEYRGWNTLKEYRPWEGVFTYHRCADSMKKYDTWKNGAPQESSWEHDEQGARHIHVEHDPYGSPFGHDILLWPDGHTQWGYGFHYVGETKEGLPEGKGIFYERGRFLDGKEPTAPILLKVHWRHTHCSPSGEFPQGEEEWTLEAKPGALDLPEYACGITVELLEPERIVLSTYGHRRRTLTPGQTVGYLDEVEGREYSDGCVYDSDEYSISVTWLQTEH